MKMIFISNNWADAHQQTRLNALLKLNLSIVAITVLRNYYHATSPLMPIVIGNVDHVSYTKRGKVYYRLYSHLSKHAKTNDFLYVFGFDLMLIALISSAFSAKKIKIIYEVPDIRELFFSKSIFGKLIRWIEKITIPKIDLLVVTSPDFITKYYVDLRKISVPDYLVIENKIHPQEIEKSSLPCVPAIADPNRKIRIGYFGVLRCPVSLDCLIKLSENHGFEIILRGIFMPLTKHYEKIVQETTRIHYLGPYQVPQDLSSIYSTVDVIWAVYPFSEKMIGNHRFARTNRFYESLYFKKPFIVQKGTADSSMATLLGNIAIEINLENTNQVIEFLSENLTFERLEIIKNQLQKIPENNCQITNEYKDLEVCLQQNKL
ncbi:glycosyltransferase family 4 protein [Dyadobacter frigoris]|uniref:Glycosyltransferase family 4 protein n=1 Tax=Dyadobacter frigoris TaxID=2576211 RepID=A0A4U6DBA2_9BACT|nr:glycosyltransferase family 4 protein [Dyadobacter frigoris]TKT94126.1 glycosyltransferase family 4 protein [Dyadobacter frigoris]GLU50663.1 hypothetical protein Dfri01_01240 [Dyadobacter frigoris]